MTASREGIAAEGTIRGRSTRQQLLEGTLLLVAERGFAGTSTQSVLDYAGVSRGSLLHHFPTRHRLMTAAAEEAVVRAYSSVEAALSAIKDPIEALRSFPGVQWRIQNDFPARAFAEILLAARWDPGLREGVREILTAWNRRLRDSIRTVADSVGHDDPEGLATEFSVLIAATQGLAATGAFLEAEGTVTRTLAALSARYEDCLLRGLGNAPAR